MANNDFTDVEAANSSQAVTVVFMTGCRCMISTKLNNDVDAYTKDSVEFNSDDDTTAVAQWLRYCATNRKVAGSIPDGVIGIFH